MDNYCFDLINLSVRGMKFDQAIFTRYKESFRKWYWVSSSSRKYVCKANICHSNISQIFLTQIFRQIYSDIYANISKIFFRQEAFERMESSIARLEILIIIFAVIVIFSVIIILFLWWFKHHSLTRLGLDGESCVLRLLCEVKYQNISWIMFIF